MIFETEEDRHHQDCLQFVLEHIGYDVEPTSTLCTFDLILSRNGREVAIVEYKRRQKPLMNPYYIDEHKIRELIGSAQSRGVKPILIISSLNPPYFWMEASDHYPTTTFTRKKNAERRGETEDVVYQIPLTDFTILE